MREVSSGREQEETYDRTFAPCRRFFTARQQKGIMFMTAEGKMITCSYRAKIVFPVHSRGNRVISCSHPGGEFFFMGSPRKADDYTFLLCGEGMGLRFGNR